MKIMKHLGVTLSLFALLPPAYADCSFLPIFHCTLDTEGQAPGNDCGSKKPFFMSYKLSKGERAYTFRKDCGASWGKNAWNIVTYSTGTWKTDGNSKQVATWSDGADHPLMTSTVSGICKTDPWLDPKAVCTKKEFHFSVSSSIIGKNGLPDIIYSMYKEILEEYVKEPFPNTSPLIPEDRRIEISLKAAAHDAMKPKKILPHPKPLP